MLVSTKGRYALRVMLELADHEKGEYVPLNTIARQQEISVKYLESILVILSKAGAIDGLRGKGGGYRLNRDPGDYTVGEILRLVAGSLAPVACLDCKPNDCKRTAECRTLPLWEKLHALIENYLDGVTLADLADSARTGDSQV